MSAFGTLLGILLCIQYVLSSSTSTISTPTSIEVLTCPFRTINYLTHTLPQQCLPSSRVHVSDESHTTGSTTTSSVGTSTAVDKDNLVGVVDPLDSTDIFRSVPTESLLNAVASSASSRTTLVQSVTTISVTSVTSAIAVPQLPETADEDSPLESGNFLSFEDWKAQNLIKAGQSEHLGRNVRAEEREPRKRQENVHDTLDSLGDDAEIDIDFSGLVKSGLDSVNGQADRPGDENRSGLKGTESGAKLRTRAGSKDAGSTSKERFNYASYDCAANVLKSNPESKSANQVLRENKDLYMLNKCSANNKFIILELCDDISIDTIVLANFEFFSSSFRTFRVSISDRYPVKIDKWKTLGTFEARNTREVQAFLIENPVIWARYIRVEFLTHYGSEFYCPVSLIRVHGTTMMEEYKHDLEMGTEEDEEEIENATGPEPAEDKLVPETTDESLLIEQYENSVDESLMYRNDSASSQVSHSDPIGDTDHQGLSAQEIATSPNEVSIIEDMLLIQEAEICSSDGRPQDCTYIDRNEDPLKLSRSPELGTTPSPLTRVDRTSSSSVSAESRSSVISTTSKHQSSVNTPNTQKETQSSVRSSTNIDHKKPVSAAGEHAKIDPSVRDVTRAHTTKQSGSGTQSQPASPTMQESFFKSVQKRLHMLESNSSLSLQYIEEQSRALRDAFRKVEQRQFSKTSTFLEQLNQTVLIELREFRQQYDQLWQSTVIELALQREQYQQESQAMHARLGVLADELIFQRRVSILQMVLILVCLALVLFSRGAINNYLELPLVQSVLSKSPGSRWINTSGDSRTTSPIMKRTRSAHQLGSKQGILKGHNRALSDDSNNEPVSASDMYSPPTPISFDGYPDVELVKADFKTEDPEFDPMSIQRPSTSPPTLPTIGNPATPKIANHLDDASIESRILTPTSSTEKAQKSGTRIEHPTPLGRHLTWDLPE